MTTRSMGWMGLLVLIALVGLGCKDGGTVVGDDDVYEDDDDTTPGDDDDDDTADDDDDTADDDTTPTDDDDDDDDDTTPTDDDDDTADDDDDDDASMSCSPWDPIDIAGASWTYQSSYTFNYEGQSQGDVGVETVETGGTTTFEGATVHERIGSFAGSMAQVGWSGYVDCANDYNVDHGSLVDVTTPEATVLTTNSSPVSYLPADPDTMIGHTWTTGYDQTVVGEAQGETLDGTWAVTWSWEVVELTQITVSAGTFDAIHIHADYQSEDVLGEHEGTLDTYWVEGIGLVYWDEQRPNEDGDYIVRELTGYGGPLAPL